MAFSQRRDNRCSIRRAVLYAVLAMPLAHTASAQQAPPASVPKPPPSIDLGLKFELEPKALDILKAAK